MFDLFAARLVTITEPGKNDVFIAREIKNLTSEEFKARPLFGLNLAFENIALILILINYAPHYSDMEEIARRVRVVEFPYQFEDMQTEVDEANANKSDDDPEIKLAKVEFRHASGNPRFISKFMLMLMETYDEKFSDKANNPNKRIIEPESVHKYTLEALKESCNEGVVDLWRITSFLEQRKTHILCRKSRSIRHTRTDFVNAPKVCRCYRSYSTMN